MHLLHSLNVYVVLGAGIAIWLVGLKCSTRSAGDFLSALGRLLSFIGLATFALAMYAGFRGPLKIAGVTLKPFPFSSSMIRQSSSEALAYVKSNVDITRRPAHGWHGSSAKALEYVVRNNGNRKVDSMNVRYSTTDGPSVNQHFYGPFPPGKTVTVIVEVPSRVSRTYFIRANADISEIVGARY